MVEKRRTAPETGSFGQARGKVRPTKKIAVIASVFLGALLSASVAYAFFFAAPQEQTASAQTAVVRVSLDEEFPLAPDEGVPLDSLKVFTGTNLGNRKAYVRADVFPCPEYHYVGTDDSGVTIDEWRPIALPQAAFTVTTTSPDWIDGGDGFLYYHKILGSGETSTEATVTVAIADPSALPAGVDVRLNVRVTMEAAQASGGVWKIVFGIPALPAGVEGSAA